MAARDTIAMPNRPADPTSALATLIAGNHRHVGRREVGAVRWSADGDSEPHPFPKRPFALALVEPGPVAVTPHIFSLGHHELIVVDAIPHVTAHSETQDIKLIVAIQPIQAQLAQVNSTWVHAELRAFSTIEAILRESARVRRAVAGNEVRVVAALLEHPSERVHWVGEHPEIDLLLRDR